MRSVHFHRSAIEKRTSARLFSSIVGFETSAKKSDRTNGVVTTSSSPPALFSDDDDDPVVFPSTASVADESRGNGRSRFLRDRAAIRLEKKGSRDEW